MNGCPCDRCDHFYTCDNMGTSGECKENKYEYFEESEEDE